MSFAGRILTQRSFALRSLTRRRAVCAHHPALVLRRGYASAHGAAQKPSDTPWLVSGVGLTVVGLAYIMSGNPAPSDAHGPKSAHASAGHHKEEKEKEKENKEKPTEAPSSEPESKPESESASESQQDKKPAADAPKGAADPSAPDKASQVGQAVPPPPADAETKQGHEETVETARAGETKPATTSSTAPSKKTATEDPPKEPKKGDNEAVQKKGSSKD
ncbi:hypothetical protein GQX73_g334 [Xylaria multiplex]|uniref:Uncharacterized protein n=1 Tax=Xylaria multiplex TaxID=323545 RepID=A0A7C8N0U5_9PEZI|nr:hypothetical protein GQX73_g334 [Xylaria multiplex]